VNPLARPIPLSAPTHPDSPIFRSCPLLHKPIAVGLGNRHLLGLAGYVLTGHGCHSHHSRCICTCCHVQYGIFAVEKRDQERLRALLKLAHPTRVAWATDYANLGTKRVACSYPNAGGIGRPGLFDTHVGKVMLVHRPGNVVGHPVAPNVLPSQSSVAPTKYAAAIYIWHDEQYGKVILRGRRSYERRKRWTKPKSSPKIFNCTISGCSATTAVRLGGLNR